MEALRNIDIKKLIKNSIPVVIFVILMAVLTVVFWPYIEALGTESGREEFKAWIDSIGFVGWLVTLGIQLLQIFVALIPGEPVELMLGYVWGPWLGTFTCLLGIFIGTLTIFLLVRKLGMKFVKKVVGTDDLTKYKFLSDKNKVDITIFILFFIPGTPKDLFTYFVGLTDMRFGAFLAISLIARAPSILTSTIGGQLLESGNLAAAIWLYGITGIVSIIGLLSYNAYIRRKRTDTNA